VASVGCLTPWLRATTINQVFWPYRPRQGYPSAPAWLVALVLIAGIVLFFLIFIVIAELLHRLGLDLGPS
jgi:hypothetical protein